MEHEEEMQLSIQQSNYARLRRGSSIRVHKFLFQLSYHHQLLKPFVKTVKTNIVSWNNNPW